MTIKNLLTVLAALPALANAGSAPSISAAALLAGARSAAHGETLDRIEGFTASGTAQVAGLTGTWRETIDRRRGRFTSAGAFQTFVLGQVYDGDSHWRIDRSGGVHRLGAAFSKRDAITDAWMLSFGYLKSQAGGAALTDAERRQRDGLVYDVVTATPRGGNPVELWFDANSHLLSLDSRREPLETVEESLSDYRVDLGALLPHRRAAPGSDVDAVAIDRYSVADPANLTFAAPPMPNDTELSRPTTVKIEDATYLVVSATLNGKGPFDFILDTGAHNIITPEVAAQLGLQSVGHGESGGAGAGTLAQSDTIVDELRVGDATMRHQHFYVIPEQYNTVERGKRPRLAGMFGLEFFERFIASIDYRGRALTLIPPGSGPVPCAGTSLPITFNDDMPLVDGAIEGHPGVLAIDSGNSGSTVVQGVWARNVGIADRLRAGIKTVSFGSGGASTNWITRGGKIALGENVVERGDLRLSEDTKGAFSSITEAANVGKQILARYRVTFDYPHERMCLVAVPGYQPPPLNRSGLITSKTDPATLKVVSVIEGTPAAAVGIVAGDDVEAIDGRAIDTMSGADVAEILRQAPGTAVHLVLTRNGARLEKTIRLKELG